MDEKQKNMNAAKPETQYQEKAPNTSNIERPIPQESDLKKVLKLEVLDL